MAKTFEDARAIILESILPVESEHILLIEATGRVLAETVKAPCDMPLWDNSAMDGFAVRAEDCLDQAHLTIIDYLPAGVAAEGISVKPGTAVKIMTGAPIPGGADAVVPFEKVEEDGDEVLVKGKVEPGEHIRFQGEDVATDDMVIEAGTVLRPPEISMLASFGQIRVPVFRKARVAILSTGDELIEPGRQLAAGQIVDSNSLALAAAVQEVGAEPVLLGIARDTPESLRGKLSMGLKADALISSAGVSAGDRDLVREILQELGVEQRFWKVQIRPGRPTAFGLKGGKPVFSLPGNPVSSLVTFEQLVRPALLKMMGHQEPVRPVVKATLQEAVTKKTDRLQFLRVQVLQKERKLLATSSGDQNTGILNSLLRANGIAILPAGREYFAVGEQVDVHLLEQNVSHQPA